MKMDNNPGLVISINISGNLERYGYDDSSLSGQVKNGMS